MAGHGDMGRPLESAEGAGAGRDRGFDTPAGGERLSGVIFAKLFPNEAEPFRGIFVAEQMKATAEAVDWAVVAPVPWVPRWVAGALGKPYVRGSTRMDDVPVFYTRYPTLPRRLLYATAAPAIAWGSRETFAHACSLVRAQFVHVHDLYPSGAAARRLCARAGLPYVLTVHGLDLYSNLENPRWRAEVEAAAAGARAIVCVSSSLARDSVAELGVDPGRVVVIPNTYDASRFRYVPRRPHDGPARLLSVGRLSSEKGHDVLLRALAELRRAGTDAELVIVGDGPERPRLESLAATLGVSSAVRFEGTVLGEQLREALAAADLFVLPSRSEGFGVVLVEALATGLPVVATRSGGPADIVAPEDGVLVPPDDASALARGIAEAIGRLTEFGREAIAERAARRYAPKSVGAQLVRLYRSVLDESPLPDSFAREARA